MGFEGKNFRRMSDLPSWNCVKNKKTADYQCVNDIKYLKKMVKLFHLFYLIRQRWLSKKVRKGKKSKKTCYFV